MWTIYIIASLLVLLVFTLCIPINIVILFSTNQKPKFTVELKWLFGLFTSKLGSHRGNINQKPQSRRKELGFRSIVNILNTRGLLKELFRLMKHIFNRMKFRKLVADIKIGLENPAELGLLFAFLTPFNILIRNCWPHSIIIQPNFSDETPLRGYAYGTARLLPILIVMPVLGFLRSRPGLIAIKKLLVARWKEKS